MKKIKILVASVLCCAMGYTGYTAYEKMTMSEAEKFMIANVEALTLNEPGGGSSPGGSLRRSEGSLLVDILILIFAPFLLFGSAIFFWWQTTKRARKAKKLIKQMAESDNAWLFADIQAVVKEGFYAIQNAWTGLDMTPAAPYMSEALQEEFQTKLNWMKYRGERNVLQDIQLKKALPVAIYDDADNTKDQVWFYIKGKMIDYTDYIFCVCKIANSLKQNINIQNFCFFNSIF